MHRSYDRSRWTISARATALTLRGDVASGDMIALSIEVPFILDRHDPRPLCVHQVYFNAQSCRRFRTNNSARMTPVAAEPIAPSRCPRWGHSRQVHSTPVPTVVRSCPITDKMLRSVRLLKGEKLLPSRQFGGRHLLTVPPSHGSRWQGCRQWRGEGL